MIEVINHIYTQRFFAKKTKFSDLFKAVTYTQYEGKTIPFWYKKIPVETSTLNLTLPTDALLSAMKSNTRNEIRRAEKENCLFEYNYDYKSFVPFYNEFCKSKGMEDKINEHTLEKYNRTLITMAKRGNTVLAMHATVINKEDKEAMLLYSCSTRLNTDVDKKLIGWSNRFLHYQEFMLFKKWGIERYEWNGICTNPELRDVYNISLFKLSFGSEAKPQLNLRTPLFVLFKELQKLLKKMRK